MPITQTEFKKYLQENGWPKPSSDALAQEYGKDVTVMVNTVLDVMFEMASGPVKPKPPPRSVGEVTAYVALLLETGAATADST